MKKVLEIREMKLGEGMPKICVPITGKNDLELREEIAVLKTSCCDVMEWRADYFEDIHNPEKVKEMLHELRILVGNIPILFTCRTKEEGGEVSITSEEYAELYRQVIETGEVDLVDTELFKGDDVCRMIIEKAHKHQVYVVMSSHDFQKTPDTGILVERFRRMQQLGADIPKIAAMPQSSMDVLKLLEATCEFADKYAEGPVISMSMGWLGGISRVSGEIFGSALTFAAAKHVSAPGQMAVSDVNYVRKLLHNGQKIKNRKNKADKELRLSDNPIPFGIVQ